MVLLRGVRGFDGPVGANQPVNSNALRPTGNTASKSNSTSFKDPDRWPGVKVSFAVQTPSMAPMPKADLPVTYTPAVVGGYKPIFSPRPAGATSENRAVARHPTNGLSQSSSTSTPTKMPGSANDSTPNHPPISKAADNMNRKVLKGSYSPGPVEKHAPPSNPAPTASASPPITKSTDNTNHKAPKSDFANGPIVKQLPLSTPAPSTLTSPPISKATDNANGKTLTGGHFDGPIGKYSPKTTAASPTVADKSPTQESGTSKHQAPIPAAGKNVPSAVTAASSSMTYGGLKVSVAQDGTVTTEFKEPTPKSEPQGAKGVNLNYLIITGQAEPDGVGPIPEAMKPDFYTCSSSYNVGSASVTVDRHGNKYLSGGLGGSLAPASGSCEAGYILGKNQDVPSFIEGKSTIWAGTALHVKGGYVRSLDGRGAITVGASTAPLDFSFTNSVTANFPELPKTPAPTQQPYSAPMCPDPIQADRKFKVATQKFPLLQDQLTKSTNIFEQAKKDEPEAKWTPWTTLKYPSSPTNQVKSSVSSGGVAGKLGGNAHDLISE